MCIFTAAVGRSAVPLSAVAVNFGVADEHVAWLAKVH